VIIGLAPRGAEPAEKRLFSYDHVNGEPVESRHGALSPYLFDAGGLADPHTVVQETNRPLSQQPAPRMGSKVVDGGHLIFSDDERKEFLAKEPKSEPYFRPLVGSREYINGSSRWILELSSAPPENLRDMPEVRQRMAAVRDFRLQSKKAKTRELANFPTQFEVTTLPDADFMVVPVSCCRF